mmetsp:Transcript_20969/g.59446  ORF Transcript_20969/g.59446 Transcript_20969/m.59446 type:complete len:244 (+) Transcript_20969:493-1224(+)
MVDRRPAVPTAADVQVAAAHAECSMCPGLGHARHLLPKAHGLLGRPCRVALGGLLEGLGVERLRIKALRAAEEVRAVPAAADVDFARDRAPHCGEAQVRHGRAGLPRAALQAQALDAAQGSKFPPTAASVDKSAGGHGQSAGPGVEHRRRGFPGAQLGVVALHELQGLLTIVPTSTDVQFRQVASDGAQPHRPRQRRGRGAHAARGVEAAEDRDPLRDLLDGEDIADRRLRRRGLPVRNRQWM